MVQAVCLSLPLFTIILFHHLCDLKKKVDYYAIKSLLLLMNREVVISKIGLRKHLREHLVL
jgi:hypothetical protein